MFTDREAPFGGNLVLPLLDLGIVELLHPATLEADQMVVVMPFIEFEDGLARLEMVALEQAGLLELRENAIDRGQADVHAVTQQMAVNIFGCDVARGTFFGQFVEQIEDLEAGERGLEANVLEVVRLGGHAPMI